MSTHAWDSGHEYMLPRNPCKTKNSKTGPKDRKLIGLLSEPDFFQVWPKTSTNLWALRLAKSMVALWTLTLRAARSQLDVFLNGLCL